MHKSQLRLLAKQFSDQAIGREEYDRARTELIDSIVAGDTTITRVPPPPPAPPPVQPEAIAESIDEDVVANKLPLIVGGAVVIVAIVIGIWLLIPGKKPAGPTSVALTEQKPITQVPAARALVEDFVAARDWSDYSINQFRQDWTALSDNERNEAISASWFRRLSKAMRQEINTQKALAGIDQTGGAVAAGLRLIKLGEFLGIADQLPAFEPTNSQSRANPPNNSPGNALGNSPEQSLEQPTVAVEIASATDTPKDNTDSEISGAAWLATNDPHAVTLQLFAVNRLDKVERLIAAHPTLAVRILAFPGAPRFRVVFGSFPDKAAAENGFRLLPAAIRAEQPKPLVKSIGELLALLPEHQQPIAASAVNSGASQNWLLAQSARNFTLQLFASDNRDNVTRLVEEHPSLDLHAVEAGGTSPPYRVLYGSFSSLTAAAAASEALPGDILKSTGKPLVKSFAELQSSTTSSIQ